MQPAPPDRVVHCPPKEATSAKCHNCGRGHHAWSPRCLERLRRVPRPHRQQQQQPQAPQQRRRRPRPRAPRGQPSTSTNNSRNPARTPQEASCPDSRLPSAGVSRLARKHHMAGRSRGNSIHHVARPRRSNSDGIPTHLPSLKLGQRWANGRSPGTPTPLPILSQGREEG